MFQVELGHIASQQNPVIDIFQDFQVRIGHAQDFFQAKAMEGAEPYAFGAFANGFNDAGLHLAGGFVGEGESEDIFAGKLGIRFEQVANSLGDDASLAGSGTGDDEQGPVTVFHGAALLCVQA
jgi:hypothetical protein